MTGREDRNHLTVNKHATYIEGVNRWSFSKIADAFIDFCKS